MVNEGENDSLAMDELFQSYHTPDVEVHSNETAFVANQNFQSDQYSEVEIHDEVDHLTKIESYQEADSVFVVTEVRRPLRIEEQRGENSASVSHEGHQPLELKKHERESNASILDEIHRQPDLEEYQRASSVPVTDEMHQPLDREKHQDKIIVSVIDKVQDALEVGGPLWEEEILFALEDTTPTSEGPLKMSLEKSLDELVEKVVEKTEEQSEELLHEPVEKLVEEVLDERVENTMEEQLERPLKRPWSEEVGIIIRKPDDNTQVRVLKRPKIHLQWNNPNSHEAHENTVPDQDMVRDEEGGQAQKIEEKYGPRDQDDQEMMQFGDTGSFREFGFNNGSRQ